MNDVINSISNREMASAIWMSVLLLFIIINRKTRDSFGAVLEALLKPVLIMPLGIGALYAALEILLLDYVGWWSVANLKTTILWLVTFAFATMFEVATAKKRKAGLGKITRDIISITGVLLFITELYDFPLPVELIALPLVTIIALTGEVAKFKPEHASVAKLLSFVLTAIGLSYFGSSLWRTIETLPETASWANALEFLIPAALSLGFLPFLYGWRVYVAYSETFTTLSIIGIDKSLIPYARRLAIMRIRSDLDLLERWRKAILNSRPSDKAELKHSLIALLALRSREGSPPVVQPRDGWSPYLAMQFMTGYGVETGYYHHSFDAEWFASSPTREIGDSLGLRNNLAYYIDGTETVATSLKIKLNINDPASASAAEDMFILHAIHLVEQAVSFDAVERLKLKIASLDSFVAEIPFGSVSLYRQEFVGGIKGGYTRKFEIQRGVHEAR